MKAPGRLVAWAELLRVSALFTVPGDALAGAVAAGGRPGRGTALAIGCSLCLYEAGMALNDWADRAEDARERPHRPLPSGRIGAPAAFLAAGALTAAGLALAARAGRPALGVAGGLAATVWAYDLWLKHTPAGPAAMGAARALDVLLGAAASGAREGAGWPGVSLGHHGPAAAERLRTAFPPAAALGVHTLAVTGVSRHETQGGSSLAPLAALATTGGLASLLARRGGDPKPPAGRWAAAAPGPSGSIPAAALLGAGYALTAGRPLLHAALNPSPPLTQRAVGGGIRAMIPLQSALAARAGALVPALATAALAPLARALSRRVSLT